MNIVIINGSPRKKGTTAKILELFVSCLWTYEFVNIEYINLSEFDISHCKGCCQCYKSGRCFISDDAEMLSEKIEKADGIIIGSPTYASNVSGILKDFIDRGHFVIEQLLTGKFA